MRWMVEWIEAELTKTTSRGVTYTKHNCPLYRLCRTKDEASALVAELETAGKKITNRGSEVHVI